MPRVDYYNANPEAMRAMLRLEQNVRGSGLDTCTTFWRGEYEGNPALRSEFFTACGLGR